MEKLNNTIEHLYRDFDFMSVTINMIRVITYICLQIRTCVENTDQQTIPPFHWHFANISTIQ